MGTGPEPLASLPVGVRRSARHVCWAARGELLAAIVEFESEQAPGPVGPWGRGVGGWVERAVDVASIQRWQF